MMKQKRKGGWRVQPHTQKQADTILLLQEEMGIIRYVPETRGDCADLISKLYKRRPSKLEGLIQFLNR